MELSRIEQIVISFLVLASVLTSGALYHYRQDEASTWYAAQLMAAVVLFVLAYSLLYKGAPRGAKEFGKDPNRSRAAIDLRDRRLMTPRLHWTRRIRRGRRAWSRWIPAVRRLLRVGTFAGAGLLLVATIVFATAAPRQSKATFELSIALALLSTLACWLHFPAQPELPSENVRQPSPLSSLDPAVTTHLELLKLEYSRGAERYENIYKAVWQNFYYMSVLSAGLLTFGQKSLAPPILAFFAVTPVAFWYFATFLPMDLYGQEVRRTLRRVETYINSTVGRNLLAHFADFANYRFHWRVRDPVRGFGAALTFAWITSSIFAVSDVARKQLTIAKNHDFENVVRAELDRLRSIPQSDSALKRQLAQIDSLLRNAQNKSALSEARGATERPGHISTVQRPTNLGQDDSSLARAGTVDARTDRSTTRNSHLDTTKIDSSRSAGKNGKGN